MPLRALTNSAISAGRFPDRPVREFLVEAQRESSPQPAARFPKYGDRTH